MKTQIFSVTDPITGQIWNMQYPQTIEEARRAGLSKCWPGTKCPIHVMQPVFFISTGKPICCTHEDAYNAYKQAIIDGEPISFDDAVSKNKDYYINDHIFKSCGHYGKHTMSGKCYQCSNANSPRQIAQREGAKVYIPEKPCPRGHVAERRVDNGNCKQCLEEDKAARKAKRPIPFYKQFPDLIISWKEAREMGLNVYRTGEPCHVGHTVYRYVATRGCLACMGR